MPVVAGQFYPGTEKSLSSQIAKLIGRQTAQTRQAVTKLVMAPHAGYIYSGAVAGQTFARARLAPTVILLGPNHTGLGAPLSVWPEGTWFFPGGGLRVEADLAGALIEAAPELSADTAAHQREHSLEVQLPFLAFLNPDCRIVPMVISERSLERLLSLAGRMARTLADWPEPVSLLVSSDMSHFLSQEETEQQDKLALKAMEQLSPELLYHTVREHNISMCGVLPMTLGMAVCRELGATSATFTGYDTSGKASGDYSRVVGYAGVIID